LPSFLMRDWKRDALDASGKSSRWFDRFADFVGGSDNRFCVLNFVEVEPVECEAARRMHDLPPVRIERRSINREMQIPQPRDLGTRPARIVKTVARPREALVVFHHQRRPKLVILFPHRLQTRLRPGVSVMVQVSK
jgi:hypothetical protein